MSTMVGSYGRICDPSQIVSSTDKTLDWPSIGWWRSDLLCIDEQGGKVVLKSSKSDHVVVVRKKGYALLGTPAFHMGDRVRARKSGKEATVVGVHWHDFRETFFFTLDYGDRVSSNWFFTEDIEAT